MKGIKIKEGTPLKEAKRTALALIESSGELLGSHQVRIQNAPDIDRINTVLGEHFNWIDAEKN